MALCSSSSLPDLLLLHQLLSVSNSQHGDRTSNSLSTFFNHSLGSLPDRSPYRDRRFCASRPKQPFLAAREADRNPQNQYEAARVPAERTQFPVPCFTAAYPKVDLGLDQISDAPDDFTTFASLLRRYGKAKALDKGRRLHARVAKNGYDCDTFLGNFLIQMYGQCGSIDEAQKCFDRLPNPNVYSWNILIETYARNGSLDTARIVFDRMPERDVVSWNAMITAYAENGHGQESLKLFSQMQADGVMLDKITFICTLDACAGLSDLGSGQSIHAAIVQCGYEGHIVVATALVNMYGKCRSLSYSRSVFEKMPKRNVISWNSMITACNENDSSKEALELFCQMQIEGIQPDQVTFILILDACASFAALEDGQKIHDAIAQNLYERDIVVGNALLNMYGKCGRLYDARNVLKGMSKRDVVSWNTMILACAKYGHGMEGLKHFHQMQLEGIRPNRVTFICTVDACTSLAALSEAHSTHTAAVDHGYEQDVVVGTSLVNMYGKCGHVDAAMNAFRRMHDKDVVAWSAMIAASTQNGFNKEALELYSQMQAEGNEPNKITFGCVLAACASPEVLEDGREIHNAIVSHRYEQDFVIGTALIKMYSKCGSLDEAKSVFGKMAKQNVVSWGAMVSACVQHGHCKDALNLFQKMHHDGVEPDEITFISVLEACTHLVSAGEGQKIHAVIVNCGYEDDAVIGSALIKMYGECGCLDDAISVFDRITHWHSLCGDAMIEAYAQNGHAEEALEMFHQMQVEAVNLDKVSIIWVLDACASLAALNEGRNVHAAIVDNGFEQDLTVGNALVNMYGRCGSLDEAQAILDKMSE